MTTKNFKPILFSTEMVQAILAGRKTQTRRVIKDELTTDVLDYATKNGRSLEVFTETHCAIKPGDILWVRETTKVGAWNDQDHKVAFDYAASPELTKTPWIEYQDIDRFEDIHLETIEALDALGIQPFRTDELNERFYYKWEPGESPLKWKPSIHMPNEAARIFLKVTDIRVQRLQNINAADSVAEGIGKVKFEYHKSINPRVVEMTAQIMAFRDLWDSINAKKHTWDSNPWVWVYEFERIDKPENFLP